MWEHCRDYIYRFHASFHDSELIVWARLQVLLGCVYAALQDVDMSVFITDKHLFTGYLIVNGALSEYLRRRRESFGEGMK